MHELCVKWCIVRALCVLPKLLPIEHVTFDKRGYSQTLLAAWAYCLLSMKSDRKRPDDSDTANLGLSTNKGHLHASRTHTTDMLVASDPFAK